MDPFSTILMHNSIGLSADQCVHRDDFLSLLFQVAILTILGPSRPSLEDSLPTSVCTAMTFYISHSRWLSWQSWALPGPAWRTLCRPVCAPRWLSISLIPGGYPDNPGPFPAQPGGLSADQCVHRDDFLYLSFQVAILTILGPSRPSLEDSLPTSVCTAMTFYISHSRWLSWQSWTLPGPAWRTLCWPVCAPRWLSISLIPGGYPDNPGPFPAQPGGLSADQCVHRDDFLYLSFQVAILTILDPSRPSLEVSLQTSVCTAMTLMKFFVSHLELTILGHP